MSLPKIKRMLVIIGGTVATLLLYFGSYFACVSIQYRHSPVFKEQTIQAAYAEYHVGTLLHGPAQWLFAPAQLFDALYLRPHAWEDRQQASPG